MDRTVPEAAAFLLDFIASKEAPRGYDTVYGNKMTYMPKPLTAMTIAEVIVQGPWRSNTFGSSACGRYQFMTATLKGLYTELGLRDFQVFEGNLQDRLAYHLLKRRGYEAFMRGAISSTEFGKRLAMEWASFPVLADCQGAHRFVKRGQSYYVGDGLNKALVSPNEVEAVLAKVRALKAVAAVVPTAPAPVPPAVLPPIVAKPPQPQGWHHRFGAWVDRVFGV